MSLPALRWHRPAMVVAILAALLGWSMPLAAQTAPSTAANGGGMAISGRVAHPRTLTLDELRAMPGTMITLTVKSEHGTQQASYTGVLLWDLVDAAQPIDEARGHLQHTILARGRDGYAVALAIGELDPQFEGKQVLIAYLQDGKPLDTMRLVVPGDAKAGRSVRDVVALEIR